MQLFFDVNFSADNPVLSPDESKHCVRVLRHKKGDIVSILDGCGSIYTAKITDANPKLCKVSILDCKIDDQREFGIHMAVAPTKNIDRFEWFLEKATEIGIEEITPIICDHSERKIIKPERLEKVLISATKQSLKSYKPTLNSLTDFKSFIKNCHNTKTPKYIAHCFDTAKSLFKDCYVKNTDAIILIGPEGDFSEKEVEIAVENNFKEISLGKARLRTETAALIGCATVNFINLTD